MMVAALLCCLASAETVPSLELSLTLSQTAVKAGDALLVKTRVENKSDAAVKWRSSPSFATNDFWLEVRAMGGGEFVKCHPQSESDDIGTGPTILEPNTGYVAHDYLLPADSLPPPYGRTHNNAFLCSEGIYELRGGFHLLYEKESPWLYSNVVKLEVVPRVPRELEVIRSSRDLLRSGVTRVDGQFSHLGDAALKTLEDKLSPSYLRTVLVWQRMVRECDPADPHVVARLESVHDVSRIVDPVTAEAIAIGLAGQLMSHKQWQRAQSVLNDIEEPSMIVSNLRQGCRAEIERAKQAGKAVEKP